MVDLASPRMMSSLYTVAAMHGGVSFRCDPQSWHPDLSWLEQCLQGETKPSMVVLVNPNNPTGNVHTTRRIIPVACS